MIITAFACGITKQCEAFDLVDGLKLVWDFSTQDQDQMLELISACKHIRMQDMVGFFHYLKASWQSVWSGLPEFLKPSEEQTKEKWFQSCFDDILRAFVEDGKFQIDAISDAFVPDISLEGLAAGILRSQAEAAMRNCTCCRPLSVPHPQSIR